MSIWYCSKTIIVIIKVPCFRHCEDDYNDDDDYRNDRDDDDDDDDDDFEAYTGDYLLSRFFFICYISQLRRCFIECLLQLLFQGCT